MIRHMQRALPGSDFDIGLRQAVKVAAARNQEAQLLGQAQVFARLPGGMGAVMDFYSVQSLFFQLTC